MSSAIKREIHLRGYHPEDFALFAFGGAGPTHVSGFLGDLAGAVEAAEHLVGLGPGLVPSGDSVVSGVLLALLVIIGIYTVIAYLLLPALWTHYEHQKGLANLPMVTRTAQGIPGDPINVGLIGDEKARRVSAMPKFRACRFRLPCVQ